MRHWINYSVRVTLHFHLLKSKKIILSVPLGIWSPMTPLRFVNFHFYFRNYLFRLFTKDILWKVLWYFGVFSKKLFLRGIWTFNALPISISLSFINFSFRRFLFVLVFLWIFTFLNLIELYFLLFYWYNNWILFFLQ